MESKIASDKESNNNQQNCTKFFNKFSLACKPIQSGSATSLSYYIFLCLAGWLSVCMAYSSVSLSACLLWKGKSIQIETKLYTTNLQLKINKTHIYIHKYIYIYLFLYIHTEKSKAHTISSKSRKNCKLVANKNGIK